MKEPAILRVYFYCALALSLSGLARCTKATSKPIAGVALVGDIAGNLYRCGIDTDGNLDNCAATPLSTGVTNPLGIAIKEFTGVRYFYGVDPITPNAYICLSSTNGSVSPCQLNNDSQPWQPTDLAFDSGTGNLYAYVADLAGAGVYRCDVNTSTGIFSACVASTGGTTGALFITFDASTGTTYGYVANWSDVYKCTLTAGGDLDVCALSNGDAAGWSPFKVNFNDKTGVKYAYVPDLGGGNIYKCTLTGSGDLGICNVTNGGISGWGPSKIDFNTLNGVTSAYISDTNGNHIYRCAVATDGDLSGCTVSDGGISGWVPVGVVFF